MRFLIDTNILIFHASNDVLEKNVKNILDNYENIIYISSESVRELIHLFQTERIKVKQWKSYHDIFKVIDEWNLTIKYVKKEHLLTYGSLLRVPDHNDPTDRLIIAQAITESIPLISSDRKFEHYRSQNLDFIYNKR
jgi:PIN domain nuclease of toxin-antitoxin system